MGDTGNREYTVFSTRYWILRTFMILALIPAFQHRNAAEGGWNRRPIHWTSEKLSALSDVIYTVSHG